MSSLEDDEFRSDCKTVNRFSVVMISLSLYDAYLLLSITHLRFMNIQLSSVLEFKISSFHFIIPEMVHTHIKRVQCIFHSNLVYTMWLLSSLEMFLKIAAHFYHHYLFDFSKPNRFLVAFYVQRILL